MSRLRSRALAIGTIPLALAGAGSIAAPRAAANHATAADCTGRGACLPDGIYRARTTVYGSPCSFTVTWTWGDGTSDTKTSSAPMDVEHRYTSHGVFTVNVTGTGTPVGGDWTCTWTSGTVQVEVPEPRATTTTSTTTSTTVAPPSSTTTTASLAGVVVTAAPRAVTRLPVCRQSLVGSRRAYRGRTVECRRVGKRYGWITVVDGATTTAVPATIAPSPPGGAPPSPGPLDACFTTVDEVATIAGGPVEPPRVVTVGGLIACGYRAGQVEVLASIQANRGTFDQLNCTERPAGTVDACIIVQGNAVSANAVRNGRWVSFVLTNRVPDTGSLVRLLDLVGSRL